MTKKELDIIRELINTLNTNSHHYDAEHRKYRRNNNDMDALKGEIINNLTGQGEAVIGAVDINIASGTVTVKDKQLYVDSINRAIDVCEENIKEAEEELKEGLELAKTMNIKPKEKEKKKDESDLPF